MQFSPPLIEAILVKRYKRFLADIRLPNGKELTVHCPNPGAMAGICDPGIRCWISDSQNPKRKLQYTLELVEAHAPSGLVLVGSNTNRPNKLAEEAIVSGRIPALDGYETLRREVKYGENSRIDILLEDSHRPPCYVEVKNVTLLEEDGHGYFPDAVTERGRKHLYELADMVKAGHRAVLMFCVSHNGIQSVAPAEHIDPKYAAALEEAMTQGVEVIAYRAHIDTIEIYLTESIPVTLSSLSKY